MQNDLMRTNNLEHAIPIARKIRYFKKVLQENDTVDSLPPNKSNNK